MSEFSPLSKGEMLPVFFFFCVFRVWSGVFCRFLPFFSSKGRFLEKFSGASFCFWALVLGLCFLVGFCLCFCFIFGGSLPEVFEKILLMSGLLFFGFVLSSFGFFRRRRFSPLFFLRDRDQVVTGHPSHALVLLVPFLVCVPPLFCFARFGRASFFLVVFRGAILGPVRFWDSP